MFTVDVVPPRLRRTVVGRPPRAALPIAIHAHPPAADPLEIVIVAIPARDEADSILDCLGSIDRAAGGCPLEVRVAVAADRCHDATASLARSFVSRNCAITVLEGRWRGVGAARAAAVEAASNDRPRAWIANTDADCRVPTDWLAAQLALARGGADAVAGVVRLGDDAPLHLLERFAAMYATPWSAGHVHAANMGVRLDAYRAVGGWSPSAVLGEEHDLWRRLRTKHFAAVHDPSLWVETSHRFDGRAPGGFAATMRRLSNDGSGWLADSA